MKNYFTKKRILQIAGILALIAVVAILFAVHNSYKQSLLDKANEPSVSSAANEQQPDDQSKKDKKDTNNDANQQDTNQAEEAKKLVTVTVVNSTGESTEYSVSTTALYLKDVMDLADGLTYETADGMVMVVNGERADYVKDGAYWAFYVNDSYCSFGIADQPVTDGDIFRIEYTKA